MRVLRNRPDDLLLQMRFPVDVFHFKSKHKETDAICGSNCNPLLFPYLRTEDGKWTFNSSVAEQTNSWFGRFLPVVRQFRVDRYNFFLDQVIMIQNARTIHELKRKGKNPISLGIDSLLKE
jgi:hypothetical protein